MDILFVLGIIFMIYVALQVFCAGIKFGIYFMLFCGALVFGGLIFLFK